MARIRLVVWDPQLAKERARVLRSAGHTVNVRPLDAVELRKVKARPPQCFVVDLSMRPSLGRDLALEFRRAKSTRHVPIVLVDGEKVLIRKTKKILPDAVYSSWSHIRSSVKSALAHPPVEPIKPESSMAGYSGTPLPKKLGIKPGHIVHLVGAPADFNKTLGPLPDGVILKRSSTGSPDLVFWFVKSLAELKRGMMAKKRLSKQGALWIIWPKQKSGVLTDVTQNHVRAMGMGSGMVDYKVCAVDETWSGLKFAHRS